MELSRLANRKWQYTQSAVHSWGIAAVDFFESIAEEYGTEEDGVAPNDDDDGVVVPRTSLNLTDEQSSELNETVNPLHDSTDYGISLYTRTVQLLRSWNLC